MCIESLQNERLVVPAIFAFYFCGLHSQKNPNTYRQKMVSKRLEYLNMFRCKMRKENAP